MTKAFDMIHAGLLEALAYAKDEADVSKFKVHIPEKVDVKALRTALGLTQDEFAQRYFFTSARVKDWEQGRYMPDGATRAYLTVIAREPKAVDRALSPPVKTAIDQAIAKGKTGRGAAAGLDMLHPGKKRANQMVKRFTRDPATGELVVIRRTKQPARKQG